MKDTENEIIILTKFAMKERKNVKYGRQYPIL